MSMETEVQNKSKEIRGKVKRGVRKFSQYIYSREYEPVQTNNRSNGKTAVVLSQPTAVTEVLKGLGCAVVAFLLGNARIYRHVTPFGTALLAAAEERIPWMILGEVASILLGGWSVFTKLFVTLMTVGARMIICYVLHDGRKSENFREPINFRMAIGAAAGFFEGMVRLISGGFQKADLLAVLLSIMTIPLLVWLFVGVTHSGMKFTARYDIGILSIAAGGALGLAIYESGGFIPTVIAVTVITLCTAVRSGPLIGAFAGMVCGLTCGVIHSPMFGILGFVAGAIRGCGSILPMLAACGSGAVFAICFEGFEAFGGSIPNMLWGAAVYIPIARLGLLPKIVPTRNAESMPDSYITGAMIASRRVESEKERIEAMSEAMSSLSSVFYAMSEKLGRPDLSEMRELCEESLKKHCKNCSLTAVCWGREYERTADAINKLAAATLSEGNSDSAFVPSDFFSKCPHVLNTISEVNLSYARRLESAARENRTAVFALDYEAMARLLRSAALQETAEHELDPHLTERARRAAVQMGLRLDAVTVFGKRRKVLIASGASIAGMSYTADEISRSFGEALGVTFSPPEFNVNGDYVTFTLHEAPVISCESAYATMKKESEEISGDSSAAFSCDDRYYSLISDGMGSGKEAAITSRVTCLFLKKMLSAGNKKNVVLEMLNDFIRHKNLECFTTVDLLEIDMLSGEASFVKSGAASSFVLRDGKLFRIASSSLPIGITREITAEEISFTLRKGDIVIMISDGISQSFEDGFWLADMLSSGISPDKSLEKITSEILSEAKKNNVRSDDMTVMGVRIA